MPKFHLLVCFDFIASNGESKQSSRPPLPRKDILDISTAKSVERSRIIRLMIREHSFSVFKSKNVVYQKTALTLQ